MTQPLSKGHLGKRLPEAGGGCCRGQPVGPGSGPGNARERSGGQSRRGQHSPPGRAGRQPGGGRARTGRLSRPRTAPARTAPASTTPASTTPASTTPGRTAILRRRPRRQLGRGTAHRAAHRPGPAADHLRRGQRGGRVDRLGVPGAERPRQPTAGDQGTRAAGRRRTRLHPGRRGPRAERPAEGSHRGGDPAAHRHRRRGQHRRGRRLPGRGGEPAVPRPDQPGHRGRGPAPGLQPAGQLRRRGRPRPHPADPRRWPARATG